MDSLNRKSKRIGLRLSVLAAILTSASLAGMWALIVHNRYEVVATGAFHPVAATGSGWVRVIRQGDHRWLELIAIRLGNQMAAETRLIAASDALDSGTVETAVCRKLGVLPAGTHSATYALDAAIDLSKYRAVALWSPVSHSNLLTAPLQVAEAPHMEGE